MGDCCAKWQFLNICGGNFRARAEACHGDDWAPNLACRLTDEEIGLNGGDKVFSEASEYAKINIAICVYASIRIYAYTKRQYSSFLKHPDIIEKNT